MQRARIVLGTISVLVLGGVMWVQILPMRQGPPTQSALLAQKTVEELRGEIARDLGASFPEAQDASTKHGALQHLLLEAERTLGDLRAQWNKDAVAGGLPPHRDLPERPPLLGPSGEWVLPRGQVPTEFAQPLFEMAALGEKIAPIERGRAALWALMARVDCPPVPRLRACAECRGRGRSLSAWINPLSRNAEFGAGLCSTCKGKGTRYPEEITPDTGQDARHASPSVFGRYVGERARISEPLARYRYGDFYHDGNWYRVTDYAGSTDLPPGYWVYVYPSWHIWGGKAPDTRTMRGGATDAQVTDTDDTDVTQATEADLVRREGTRIVEPPLRRDREPSVPYATSDVAREDSAPPPRQHGGFIPGTEEGSDGPAEGLHATATLRNLVGNDQAWDLSRLGQHYTITKIVRDRDTAGRIWRVRFFLRLRSDVWDFERVLDGITLRLALCDDQDAILGSISASSYAIHGHGLTWAESASGEDILNVRVADLEWGLQRKGVSASSVTRLKFTK